MVLKLTFSFIALQETDNSKEKRCGTSSAHVAVSEH